MSYDEKVAARIRGVMARYPDVTERKMFGGLMFLLDGKMVMAASHRGLMVRVGPDAYEAALQRAHVRMMDFTGRPMIGFVYVAPAGWRTAAALVAWITQAASYVAGLPVKKRRKRPRPIVKRTRRAGGR